MPYANGYISQWDQFTAQVQQISSKVPYMIARFSLLAIILIHRHLNAILHIVLD